MIIVNVKVDDSVDEIENQLLDKIRLHLNAVFKRAAGSIQARIKNLCEEVIKGTEAYDSLLSGELLGELGVPDIKPRLEKILTTIKNSVEVQSIPLVRQGKEFAGGLVFKMIRSDLMDILELSEASYQTEKNTTIPWLQWLLLQGDTILVIGYDVRMNLTQKEKYRSRTGLALMEKGSGWRVPPEWSGTVDNNFITRAFDYNKVQTMLIRIMEEEISSRV